MEKFVRTVNLCNSSKEITNLISYRFGHTLRGRPPTTARSLAQRLQENSEPPKPRINIGFPQLLTTHSLKTRERLNYLKTHRQDSELEKLSRTNELKVDLANVTNDWLTTNGPHQIHKIAQHYGIYEHLFAGAYFIPRVPLNVAYVANDGERCPAYYGNVIKPSEATTEPEVSFDQTYFKLRGDNLKDQYWTLVMTNPDGNFDCSESEYVHWFIGNIPSDGDVNKGEKIVPYLQPIPPKGTGFHRHIFVLYKQDSKIDFSKYSIDDPVKLSKRSFKTIDFYVENQDNLTPVGLSFFQSDWDPTLTDFYHKTLGLDEPLYEYDFPEPYIKEQKWFPLKEPFNLYMDKYRDQKQVAQEYLEMRLQNNHPFLGPKKPLRFPNAHPLKDIPSWLKTEKRKNRLKWGRINDFL